MICICYDNTQFPFMLNGFINAQVNSLISFADGSRICIPGVNELLGIM